MLNWLASSKSICLLLIAVVLTVQTVAQTEGDAPLVGPVLALTTAQQDRILLYDVGMVESTPRELRFGSGELHVWDFSPDGCQVLFTLDTSENMLPQMYVADLDGSNMQQVVEYPELEADAWGIWEPDWSSDGIIAFNMIRDRPQGDGSRLRENHIAYVSDIGNEPGFYSVTGREFTPQWSPDAKWLAYVSYDERVAGADVQSTAVPTTEPLAGVETPELPTVLEADMWVVSADGETKYRLTTYLTGTVRAPRWSPDNELLSFIYSPSPSNDTIWMIANENGAIPTQLSFLWNLTLDHTFLPDSSAMIAAVRDFRGTNENQLWRIPLVGNADNDGTLFLAGENYRYSDYPRFHETGAFLAFRSGYRVIVVNMQDLSWQRFADTPPGNTPPVWSPAAFAGEESCGA